MSLFEEGRLDDALHNLGLGLAVSLLKRSGHVKSAINARSNMAWVWMRMGRPREVLATLDESAEQYRRSSDRIGEFHAQ